MYKANYRPIWRSTNGKWNGISILGAEYLIPFKMYAWLDLRRRKANGEHVNEKDYKKHKNDVFRLIQIINAETQIKATGLVKESIDLFIKHIVEEPVRVEQFGLPLTMDDVLDILQNMYI